MYTILQRNYGYSVLYLKINIDYRILLMGSKYLCSKEPKSDVQFKNTDYI